MSVNNSVSSTTGLLPLWTYYTGTVAGTGSHYVNVANGNLVFVAGDVNVSHKVVCA